MVTETSNKGIYTTCILLQSDSKEKWIIWSTNITANANWEYPTTLRCCSDQIANLAELFLLTSASIKRNPNHIAYSISISALECTALHCSIPIVWWTDFNKSRVMPNRIPSFCSYQKWVSLFLTSSSSLSSTTFLKAKCEWRVNTS